MRPREASREVQQLRSALSKARTVEQIQSIIAGMNNVPLSELDRHDLIISSLIAVMNSGNVTVAQLEGLIRAGDASGIKVGSIQDAVVEAYDGAQGNQDNLLKAATKFGIKKEVLLQQVQDREDVMASIMPTVIPQPVRSTPRVQSPTTVVPQPIAIFEPEETRKEPQTDIDSLPINQALRNLHSKTTTDDIRSAIKTVPQIVSANTAPIVVAAAICNVTTGRDGQTLDSEKRKGKITEFLNALTKEPAQFSMADRVTILSQALEFATRGGADKENLKHLMTGICEKFPDQAQSIITSSLFRTAMLGSKAAQMKTFIECIPSEAVNKKQIAEGASSLLKGQPNAQQNLKSAVELTKDPTLAPSPPFKVSRLLDVVRGLVSNGRV